MRSAFGRPVGFWRWLLPGWALPLLGTSRRNPKVGLQKSKIKGHPGQQNHWNISPKMSNWSEIEPCVSMCIHVYPCVSMCIHVYPCVSMFQAIWSICLKPWFQSLCQAQAAFEKQSADLKKLREDGIWSKTLSNRRTDTVFRWPTNWCSIISIISIHHSEDFPSELPWSPTFSMLFVILVRQEHAATLHRANTLEVGEMGKTWENQGQQTASAKPACLVGIGYQTVSSDSTLSFNSQAIFAAFWFGHPRHSPRENRDLG